MTSAMVDMEGRTSTPSSSAACRRARNGSNESNGRRDDDASEGRGESSQPSTRTPLPSQPSTAPTRLRSDRFERARVRRCRPRANGEGGAEGGRSSRSLRARRGVLAEFANARGYLRRGVAPLDGGGSRRLAAEGSVSRALTLDNRARSEIAAVMG